MTPPAGTRHDSALVSLQTFELAQCWRSASSPQYTGNTPDDLVRRRQAFPLASHTCETEQAKVVLQLVLAVCGFIPVVGEPCDAVDALIAYLDGDKTGGGLSLLAMIPGAGILFGGARGVDLARQLKKLKKAGCPGSSFLPGTPVLMADRSTRPIQDVGIGDKVLATDPLTGRTRAKPVTATITSAGYKALVDVTVDTDGKRGGKSGTVTATDNHRFWDAQASRWVRADELKNRQFLRSAAGKWVQITAAAERRQPARVHNLSIAGIHTY